MSIFEVSTDDIEALNDEDLRLLVGHLSTQELLINGQSASHVTYGGNQNASDGGIDVRVDAPESITGFVPRRNTGFQVKAEDMPAGEIREEMKPGGSLRESIIELGKAGGSYVIVSSKGSLSDTALTARRNAMAAALADNPEAAGLLVDFYDRRRIATWTNQHPGLITWVRQQTGKPLSGWRPYADWSSSPNKTAEEYLVDGTVRLVGAKLTDGNSTAVVEGINQMRSILAKPNGIARLVGLSGVGKTRLVQALFDDRLGENAISPHIAVYADLADEPDPVPLELLERLRASRQQCVLVVDNCGFELHQRLARRLRSSESKISLLTIEYDITDDEPEGTDIFKLEPASKDLIEKILTRKYPALSHVEISTIASFSEGNSRVAIALAETSKSGESLANLKDSELFRRLFGKENADLLRTAKACALVYSFDGEDEASHSELALLAALANQTVTEFRANVAELVRRQLVQKRSKWRALLPHALAHRLAKEMLQEISATKIADTFAASSDERIVKSFTRRLGYLHDSPEAQAIAAYWMKDGGWLAETETLNEYGRVLFDNIASINPEASLLAIEAAFARTDPANQDKRLWTKLVQILRLLAYDPKFFDRAVSLIAKLAVPGDPSNNTSDAINIFESLFHIYLSGTMTGPEQRANLLRELGASSDPANQRLALKGLEAMLKCTHFTSYYSFEFGARKRDYGYSPRIAGEIEAWFSSAFQLARDFFGQPALEQRVRELVASRFAELARAGFLGELYELAQHFLKTGGWPEGWAGVRAAIKSAKRRNLPIDDKLLALDKLLSPSTLSHRITSYVLPEAWSRLDLADEDADDPQRFAKAEAALQNKCLEIGAELARDSTALVEQLPILLGAKSNRGGYVSESLAANTGSPDEIWKLILEVVKSTQNASTAFLSGFMRGLGARDRALCDRLLDESLGVVELHPHFVMMQINAGMDALACERLKIAVQIDTVPTFTLFALATGRACDNLEPRVFCELVREIAKRPDGLLIALDIVSMRFHTFRSDGREPGDLERECGRDLLLKLSFDERGPNSHHWVAEVARNSLRPGIDSDTADAICQNLLQALSDYRANAYEYAELISVIAKSFPNSVLNILVEKTASPYEGRGAIFSMFRGERTCPLDAIADDDLIAWAAIKPAERHLYLAECVRLFQKEDGAAAEEDEAGSIVWTPIANRLVEEAADPIAVLRIYVSRFQPSGWSGSLARILASRTQLLTKLKSHENSTIASWAAQAEIEFARSVEKVRSEEERDSRERDERFEW